MPPTLLPGALPDGSALEVSIHLLGPDLQREVLALFPGGHCHRGTLPPAPLGAPPPALPSTQQQQQPQPAASAGPDAPDGEHSVEALECRGPAAFLACLTFQFAAGGVSLAPDSSAHTLDKASWFGREMCMYVCVLGWVWGGLGASLAHVPGVGLVAAGLVLRV